MPTAYRTSVATFALALLSVSLMATFSRYASAQQTPLFTPGNVVVLVEGCGLQSGTCTPVNGSGTGAGNSSSGGYGDNQATPMTLMQFLPTGTSSVSYVNSLVLPQTSAGANLPFSGEYGSSSEGGLQLSGAGQYLTVMGYAINAAAYNASPSTYGTLASKPTALAQSGSLTGQSYTPIARAIALIDPSGNVNTSTAIYNVFNQNNPRSAYTADGLVAYISGQGTGSDTTGGVFYTPVGAVNNSPTAITGLDASGNTIAQETRTVQIYNGTLYVSTDTKEGSNNSRSFVGTLGKPPATSVYNGKAGPTQLTSTNSSGAPVSSAGKITLTASETNSVNGSAPVVNLSPSGYFFANASTLYIADTGSPKQTSAGVANGGYLGDGGLQKWINSKPDGTGTTWVYQYNLSAGLNLVANMTAVPADTTGTTGLYSVTGVVSGANVYLYAVNYTINDLDQTYLYGITDTLASTTNPGTTFTKLATAPVDSNFKGVSMAPSYPAGSATITTVPAGLSVTTSGTGCVPGTYATPVTLVWTPGSTCSLKTTAPQFSSPNSYVFSQWQDGTTNTTDVVTAPATRATYTATFTTTYQPVGALEKANDSSTASTTLLKGDSLLVSGWVADPVDGSPLSNVKVYVDGFLFGTPTVGISRPDVASANNNSAYANSGYQLVASTSGLSLGTHSVTVIAGDSTSRMASFGPLSVNVVATSPAYVFVAGSGNLGSFDYKGNLTSAATAGGGTGSAVDASGNVWSIGNGSALAEFNPAGALANTYSSLGLSGATALAIDGSSQLWVANGNGTLSVVSNAGAAVSTAKGSSSAAGSGVAVDLSGNVWVANTTANNVDEVVGGAAPVAPLATSVTNGTVGAKP